MGGTYLVLAAGEGVEEGLHLLHRHAHAVLELAWGEVGGWVGGWFG